MFGVCSSSPMTILITTLYTVQHYIAMDSKRKQIGCTLTSQKTLQGKNIINYLNSGTDSDDVRPEAFTTWNISFKKKKYKIINKNQVPSLGERAVQVRRPQM